MNEAPRLQPKAPVGSFILVALMYLPWLLYFFPEQLGKYFYFIILFGFFYCLAVVALAAWLYRRRDLSRAHRIAFYANLGVLAMFAILFWRPQL